MTTRGKILLVDDERDLVKMVSLRLRSAGYEVVCAYDGQEALEQVKEHNPDLIILDVMMPKMDGYQVCRTLKFDDRTQDIPVLVFTARAQKQDVDLAMESGADAYLTKPFDADELIQKLQILLPSGE